MEPQSFTNWIARAVFVEPRVYGTLIASRSCVRSVKLFRRNWMVALSLYVNIPTCTPLGLLGLAISKDATTFVTNCVTWRKLSSPMLPEASIANTTSAEPLQLPVVQKRHCVTTVHNELIYPDNAW